MKTGTIVDFRGSWGSGIATLLLKVGKKHQTVPCENAQTVRALDAMFGNVITPGHGVDVFAIRGKKVQFDVDDIGVLSSLSPVE